MVVWELEVLGCWGPTSVASEASIRGPGQRPGKFFGGTTSIWAENTCFVQGIWMSKYECLEGAPSTCSLHLNTSYLIFSPVFRISPAISRDLPICCLNGHFDLKMVILLVKISILISSCDFSWSSVSPVIFYDLPLSLVISLESPAISRYVA